MGTQLLSGPAVRVFGTSGEIYLVYHCGDGHTGVQYLVEEQVGGGWANDPGCPVCEVQSDVGNLDATVKRHAQCIKLLRDELARVFLLFRPQIEEHEKLHAESAEVEDSLAKDLPPQLDAEAEDIPF